MSREDIAKNINKKQSFCILSTASLTGEPWVTPVYFAYDTQFSLYWYSGRKTKHSLLIENNDRLAVVIFNSQYQESHPIEEGYGVYMIGRASIVKEEELSSTLTIYFTRLFSKNTEEKEKMIKSPQDFLGNSPLRMYKFIPESISLSNTATMWRGKYIDSRSEIL